MERYTSAVTHSHLDQLHSWIPAVLEELQNLLRTLCSSLMFSLPNKVICTTVNSIQFCSGLSSILFLRYFPANCSSLYLFIYFMIQAHLQMHWVISSHFSKLPRTFTFSVGTFQEGKLLLAKMLRIWIVQTYFVKVS